MVFDAVIAVNLKGVSWAYAMCSRLCLNKGMAPW